MIEIEGSSSHHRIVSHCLELEFNWRDDHWKHEMTSVGSCASIPRIWSIEAGPDLDDLTRIAGPVYQQLHVQREKPELVRALLVGQAGPHHFSAAFTVEERPDGATIDVDVADRCTSPIKALAATYLIEASDAELRHSETSASLTWHHPESRLEIEGEPPTIVSLAEGSIGTIKLQALARIEAGSQTHRFRYRWHWQNSPKKPIRDHTA